MRDKQNGNNKLTRGNTENDKDLNNDNEGKR